MCLRLMHESSVSKPGDCPSAAVLFIPMHASSLYLMEVEVSKETD